MGSCVMSCYSAVYSLLCLTILNSCSNTASLPNGRWALKAQTNNENIDAVLRLRRSVQLNHNQRSANKTRATDYGWVPNGLLSKAGGGRFARASAYLIGQVWPGNDAYSSKCNHSQDFRISKSWASGVIKSPTVRGYYPVNCVCRWRIITHGKKNIRLKFEKFDLEYSDFCAGDSLTVYDGPDESSRRIDSFCGERSPGTVTTYNDNILIKFISDHFNRFNQGFRLEFKVSAGQQGTPDVGSSSIESVPARDWGAICSEKTVTLEQSSGYITSPSEAGYYPVHAVCRWRIIVPNYQRIKLDFIMLDVENDEKCMSDTLWVFDGRDEHSVLLGKFCGKNLPEPVRSAKHYMFLLFTSDDRHRYNRGFKIQFTAV